MRRLILMVATVAALTGAGGAARGQIFDSGFDANDACIDLKIRYRVCGTCPFCWPCADIGYWIPKWAVEVSRDADSKGRPSRGDGDLHFFQVKVKPMTKGVFQQPCNENRSCVGGCFRPTIGALVDHFYDSRRDDDWLLNSDRMTGNRTMPPFATFMMIAPPTGTWGRALPRAGHVIHSSPLAASGLAALRGFNIARYPYDLWPLAGLYRLDGCQFPDCGPLVPNAQFPEVGPFPCMQLEKPARLGCAAAGFDFSTALRAVAPDYQDGEDGQYTWVIWKHRTCTCPVPLGYCAAQLRGLGDDNRCVAPRSSLASLIQQVGQTVIGELQSSVGVLADNLREELDNQLSSVTDGFANLTGTTQGQGAAPVSIPVACSRSQYQACGARNRAALQEADDPALAMLEDCSYYRSYCCDDSSCSGRF